MCLYDGLILKANESLDSFGVVHRGRSHESVTCHPLLSGFREKRTLVSLASPLGHVAGSGAGQDGSGRTCSRSGFLDETGVIWLSRSAASSAAPVLFPGPSSAKLCPWTPKPLPLPAFLKHPITLSSSRPEAVEESSLPCPSAVVIMMFSKPVFPVTEMFVGEYFLLSQKKSM